MKSADIRAYGTWEVTTEGDCEGRTTKNLGTHSGYLDEIALSLARQAHYSLEFKQVKPILKRPAAAESVNVRLSIDSGTWNLTDSDRINFFKDLLRDRDVIVKRCTYFASVTLYGTKSLEEQEKVRNKILAESAKSKLSRDELEALKSEFAKG